VGPKNANQLPGSGVQSIDRITAILGAFTHQHPALGVTEIASQIGLATSTVHRLLVSLEFNGFVRQASDRRYVLGPLLLQLAYAAATHSSLREIALPVMQQLRDQAEETVGLHELAGPHDRVTIAQAESRLALRRTYTDLGAPVPLPQGAPGKALLAFLPTSQQEEILNGRLDPVTDATITDPDELRAQLRETRRTGYSISLGERTPGTRAIASPIWDHTGYPIACMSISAPEIRMPLKRLHDLGEMVKASAWEISKLMGATVAVVSEHALERGVLTAE
jgi:IclR family acetate operon transcriptional repressor